MENTKIILEKLDKMDEKIEAQGKELVGIRVQLTGNGGKGIMQRVEELEKSGWKKLSVFLPAIISIISITAGVLIAIYF
jgi:hypothetical protein